MGWETRKGRGRYYTRSRRVNGRVIREYVGCGGLAEALASLDALDRLEREEARILRREELAEWDEIGDELIALGRVSKVAVAAALQEHGFHQHKGQWRRKRGK